MALDQTNCIIGVDELADYMGDIGSTAFGRYSLVINAVSHLFNTYTNRKLKARSLTEYYDGNGGSELYVDNYPIVSTSTNIDIRVDTDRSYSTSDKVASTDIIIDSEEGRIRLDDDTFDTGAHSVKIVYTAGYSTGTMPYDLKYAAMEMSRFYLNREKSNRVGVRSEGAEGGSITYETDMPWSVKQVLELYRRPNG